MVFVKWKFTQIFKKLKKPTDLE